MTKEELKQEVEEWLNKWELCNKCEHKAECIEECSYCYLVVNRAYLAGAEPREKRIAELEKENAELKEQHEVSARNMSSFIESLSKSENEAKKQLTKAKELLKQWLQTSKASGCDNINIVTDTELFLKECK